MDLKVYEKTRYQNILRHKKNKNYIIRIPKPNETSISKDSKGNKIFDIDLAIKIRNNALKSQNKANLIDIKTDVDTLYSDYIENCKYDKKLAYNTLVRKIKTYNKYIKNKINKSPNKLNKDFWMKFVDSCDCTNIQKNIILKEMKAFYNWLIEEDLVSINPILKIKKYPVQKIEMKYWNPNELKIFLNYLNLKIESNSKKERLLAYRTKILTLINFNVGDRIGETRALHFSDFDEINNILRIRHSINYDRTSKDFCSTTKTYQSQRDIDITPKLINEIIKYKKFLIQELEIDINKNTLIFFNYDNNMPFTDTTLRNTFYRYCKEAGVKRIRLYDLRHTYVATMMSENKELYLISERLGHKKYSTTVNEYGHLSNSVRKEVAEVTDKYF